MSGCRGHTSGAKHADQIALERDRALCLGGCSLSYFALSLSLAHAPFECLDVVPLPLKAADRCSKAVQLAQQIVYARLLLGCRRRRRCVGPKRLLQGSFGFGELILGRALAIFGGLRPVFGNTSVFKGIVRMK